MTHHGPNKRPKTAQHWPDIVLRSHPKWTSTGKLSRWGWFLSLQKPPWNPKSPSNDPTCAQHRPKTAQHWSDIVPKSHPKKKQRTNFPLGVIFSFQKPPWNPKSPSNDPTWAQLRPKTAQLAIASATKRNLNWKVFGWGWSFHSRDLHGTTRLWNPHSIWNPHSRENYLYKMCKFIVMSHQSFSCGQSVDVWLTHSCDLCGSCDSLGIANQKSNSRMVALSSPSCPLLKPLSFNSDRLFIGRRDLPCGNLASYFLTNTFDSAPSAT